jgi:hypothetical protein
VEVDEDAAGGYALAYDEAVRALSQQRDSFESLRTRAGVVLSASAVATSLLARHAVSIWALSVFGALVASLAAVLWPSREASTPSPTRLLAMYVERAASVALIHRDLVIHMDAAYNRTRIVSRRS